AAMTVTLQPWHAAAASTPSKRMAVELIAYHDPEKPASKQYQALLTRLLEDLSGEARVILLSGFAPGSGTTTALLNLAISGCRGGERRVAVVDVNLRRPGVAERLGLLEKPGLQEGLAGRAALEQALQVAALENLHALTAAPRTGGAIDLLTEQAAAWVVGWLKQRYDLVFLDAPVWEETAELTALAEVCNALYLVVHQADAQRPRLTVVSRA